MSICIKRRYDHNFSAEQMSEMNTVTTHDNDDDEVKQRILDTALQLFTDYGLRRTTMEDVASRCGIGRATLYRRFRDKDQLFQAVIFREMRRNMMLIDAEVRSQPNPLDGLIEAFVKAAHLSYKHPLLSRLLDSEPETVLPYLTRHLGVSLQFASQFLTMHIQGAQKKGELSSRPSGMLAEMVLRLVQSLVLSPSPEVDPGSEESLRSFANICLRPVLAP